MTEHLKFNTNTLYDETDLTNWVLIAETDLNGRRHMIEELGDPYQNIYRATQKENRVYEVTLLGKAGGGSTVLDLMNAFDLYHSAIFGEKVVERKTGSDTVLQLDAVAEAPEWRSQTATQVEVTQRYIAANPWWRSSSESSNNASFNGATPVNLAVNNTGDIPTWVRFVITGIVNTPKIAYGTDWELEFTLNMTHANDELAIVCKTPASVWYTPNGGSAEKAYGYRTSDSMFRKAKAPTGNNNLTLSATSGTANCVAYWYNLYEALV